MFQLLCHTISYTCTFTQKHTQIQPHFNTATNNYISLVPLEGNLDIGGGAGVLLLLLYTLIIIFNHLHPSSLLLLALSSLDCMFEMSRDEMKRENNPLLCSSLKLQRGTTVRNIVSPHKKWSFTARHWWCYLHLLDSFPSSSHQFDVTIQTSCES